MTTPASHVPSTVPFEYILHDTLDSEERTAQIAASAGVEIDEELAEKIGRPFYEIRVHCTLDTRTGYVSIHNAERVHH
jgi:hypothetical protein